MRALPVVQEVVAAGSVRRMRETIGDADFLVASNDPNTVMEFFVSMPEVIDIIGKGQTKSTVKITTGMDLDIRVISEESFGAALQYFTGSKDHNIILRRIAHERGFKLSEYGLFRGEQQVAGRTEMGVYEQ